MNFLLVAVTTEQIDNYIIEHIYLKDSLSQQRLQEFENLVSEYHRQTGKTTEYSGWLGFARVLAQFEPKKVIAEPEGKKPALKPVEKPQKSRISYLPYNKNDFKLAIQLRPASTYETQELEKQLEAITQMAYPTEDDFVEHPKKFEHFKSEVDRFEKLLFGYHYRPNPINPQTKQLFAPKDFNKERAFENWLLDAQKKVAQLEAAKTKLIEQKSVMDKAQKALKDVNAQFKILKDKIAVRPYEITQLEELLKKLREAITSYNMAYKIAFDDHGLIDEVESWIKSKKELKTTLTAEQLAQERKKVKAVEDIVHKKFNEIKQLPQPSLKRIKELEELVINYEKAVNNFRMISQMDYKGAAQLLSSINTWTRDKTLALRRQALEKEDEEEETALELEEVKLEQELKKERATKPTEQQKPIETTQSLQEILQRRLDLFEKVEEEREAQLTEEEKKKLEEEWA